MAQVADGLTGNVQRTGGFPPQLCAGNREILERKVSPVRNNPKRLSKPLGGFWTSTYGRKNGSAWVSWWVAYRYNDPLELHRTTG
jgi:hypothetical protein